MPRTSVNYQNTIIYKIVCNDLNVKDLYVGHTTDFKRRKSEHRKKTINENDTQSYNFKIYKIIRENGGWDNWSMIEIEKYPCNDSNEATTRERYWFEDLQANLNTHYPQRTKKEYIVQNKEKIKEAYKEYCEQNKEKLSEMHKDYYEANKTKLLNLSKQYYHNNIEFKKEYEKKYYDKNKEIVKEKNKTYYRENKDLLNKTITCECGGHYSIPVKARHQKSIKHIKFIDQQNI